MRRVRPDGASAPAGRPHGPVPREVTVLEKELVDQLRIFLFIGLGITLAALYIDIISIVTSDPEAEEEE